MSTEAKEVQEEETTPVAPPTEEARTEENVSPATTPKPTKFCSHCGKSIDAQAVICPLCGCQVDQVAAATPNIVINNTNTNTNTQVQQQTMGHVVVGRPKNKWVAVLLCLFLGVFGAHKFYEGKIVMGIVYLCTGGLCGFGALVDLILLLMKPNPYFV